MPSPTPMRTIGNLELACDRDDDAALCGAVELGQDDPVETEGGVELARLRKPVLSGRRVHDKQTSAQVLHSGSP